MASRCLVTLVEGVLLANAPLLDVHLLVVAVVRVHFFKVVNHFLLY